VVTRRALLAAGISTRQIKRRVRSGALLRGRAAAHLHGLLRGPAPPPEVMAPTERLIEGLITCRSRRIDPQDAMTVLAIPVTTVARTLVDLAAVLSVDALARAAG
jgi:hypothetical protein